MPSKHNKFYIWVHKQLLDHGLTVTKLAAIIGWPQTTVSRAINHLQYPHVINAIATHFNYDPKTEGPIPISPARPERRIRTSIKGAASRKPKRSRSTARRAS